MAEAIVSPTCCLQELNCEPNDFPAQVLRKAGYSGVWEGQKSWKGVTIVSKRSNPIVTRRRWPSDPTGHRARYIEAAVDGMSRLLLSAERKSSTRTKVRLQMKWFSRLARHPFGGSFGRARCCRAEAMSNCRRAPNENFQRQPRRDRP